MGARWSTRASSAGATRSASVTPSPRAAGAASNTQWHSAPAPNGDRCRGCCGSMKSAQANSCNPQATMPYNNKNCNALIFNRISLSTVVCDGGGGGNLPVFAPAGANPLRQRQACSPKPCLRPASRAFATHQLHNRKKYHLAGGIFFDWWGGGNRIRLAKPHG